MRDGLIDLLDLPATRARLHALAEIDAVDDGELERGLKLLGLRPDKESWGKYLYWHALIIGVVLLAAGTVFFVAANWSAMGPFARMGSVGGAMVLATLLGGFLGNSLAGRAASLLGGLLFGPTLAVYGQVYQTGADPWELFALWTLVMTAYGVVTRFSGAWVLAMVLLHISVFTWVNQELGTHFYSETGGNAIAVLGVFDALIVALSERFVQDDERRVVPRCVAYFGLLAVLPFGIMIAVGEYEAGGAAGTVVLVLGLAAIWAVYRWRRSDVVMLAGFAGAVTTIVSSAAGKFILDTLDMELFGVAALGGIIIAQVWLFTRWLLAWRREGVAA
jgi:uncharacterized membrane protein